MERIAQANEELRKTHEKLVQSEKLASIGILASGVALEINNPLGGLFNCLQMLRQKGDDPEFRRRYLDLVREGLDRIENTVNKLLWMSRKTEHAPVEVNIRNSVDSVYAFVEYKLEKEKVVFDNQVPAELFINIDVHDFQQLLLNLFINAIHAMKGGGTLQVTGSRRNGAVVVTVSDTGCGIVPEHLSRIFDPFFTTKPTGEGTGLGLWLTYEIVKNYHGEISAKSEVGKGSAFKAIFPMKESI
jgi:signal transduction histidine kinase